MTLAEDIAVPDRKNLFVAHGTAMQSSSLHGCCPECLNPMVDAGEELACQRCGVAMPKETSEVEPIPAPGSRLRTEEPLGSYMGSVRVTAGERYSRGLSGSQSKYEYLKKLSDFAGKADGPVETCGRMIQRVGEKLLLPKHVIDQAKAMSKSVLESFHGQRRATLAVVSAYALISACKVEGISSVSVREIIGAHTALGRRIRFSSIIQLSLESPFKTFARKPEDYISRVLGRLTQSQDFARRLRRDGTPGPAYLRSLREAAMEVLQSIDRKELAGRRPCALAASAVYSAECVLSTCESRRRRLTQRELAECGDTAEYTIREQCARVFPPAVEAVVTRKRRPLPAQAAG
jgi:transcription initiation factor TFIIIB Brf1 subunit/transcription initiation factor TFIIB